MIGYDKINKVITTRDILCVNYTWLSNCIEHMQVRK